MFLVLSEGKTGEVDSIGRISVLILPKLIGLLETPPANMSSFTCVEDALSKSIPLRMNGLSSTAYEPAIASLTLLAFTFEIV